MEPPDLYPRALGAAWPQLDEAVRRLHRQGHDVRARGSFRVTHGSGWANGLLAGLLRLPRASQSATTELTIARQGEAEQWLRRFEGQPLVTRQWYAGPSVIAERFAGFEVHFALQPDGGALVYRQTKLYLRLGPLRLACPRWLAPRIAARESTAGQPLADVVPATHITVRVTLPLLGLLVAYEGTIVPVDLEHPHVASPAASPPRTGASP